MTVRCRASGLYLEGEVIFKLLDESMSPKHDGRTRVDVQITYSSCPSVSTVRDNFKEVS